VTAKGGRLKQFRTGNHYRAPLSVGLEGDALVIRIGTQTLAHAVTYSEWAHNYENKAADYFRTFCITDAVMFADDVKRAMLDEREDGSTPLSNFIDKMAQAAVEDGSLATDEARIKYGETDHRETWAKDDAPTPACSNCGCEERDHRGILTCRCVDLGGTS
jgi:hypothetical protein